MTCVHLRKLYQLCQEEDLRLGSSDLIRIVCQQCGVQDECPSLLMGEYEAMSMSAPLATSPESTKETTSVSTAPKPQAS